MKTPLLTFSLALAATAILAQQPNILIILADDLGYEALGTYGGLDYSTPELDTMAAEGVRFDRAYTSPVCTPTRVSLHTSLYTSDHGHTRVLPVHNGTSDIVDFIAMPTFAQLLRAAGYRTSVTGKWQLATYDKNPTHLTDSGFDSWYIWQIWDDAAGAKTKRYWDGTFNHDGTKLEFTGTSQYGPDLLADYVTDQMTAARDAGEPFLIVHNMLLPHEEDGFFIQTPDDVALSRPASLANMINYMDKLVGQILYDVDALGIRENTYVFFIGDNGTDTDAVRNTVDGPVTGQKRTLDDGGTHVPFIVWGPSGIGANRTINDLVDITDVFPTVCSLAGVNIPGSIPYRGHSLVPQLEGRPGLTRRYVHQGIYDIFDNQEREAIFDGEWRLQLDGTLTDGRVPTSETTVAPGNPEGDAVRPRVQYALDYYGNRLSAGGSSVIAEEFFNSYGSSTTNIDGLNGGIGWSSSWGSSDTDDDDSDYIQGTGLSWIGTGYDDSKNLTGANDGALVYAGDLAGSAIPSREFSTSATTLWFSALISIDETNDRAVLWIDSTTSSVNSGDFFGVMDGNIQMRYNGSSNYTSAGAPTTGTHLLLGKAEINVSGSNDRLSFWFNPVLSGGEAGLGTATYSDASANTFGTTIDGIGILLRDNTQVPIGGEIIDAIRIGTSFESVTVGDAPADALDIWRRLEFGPDVVDDPLQEATLWGDLLDPDKDGIATIFEYYRGTHPLKSDAEGPRPVLYQTAGQLRLRQVERLNDTRGYLLQEVSPDMSPASWDPASSALEEQERSSLNLEHDEVIHRLAPATSHPLFVRDSVTIP
jgi:arylsulfatase A-like enzyme